MWLSIWGLKVDVDFWRKRKGKGGGGTKEVDRYHGGKLVQVRAARSVTTLEPLRDGIKLHGTALEGYTLRVILSWRKVGLTLLGSAAERPQFSGCIYGKQEEEQPHVCERCYRRWTRLRSVYERSVMSGVMRLRGGMYKYVSGEVLLVWVGWHTFW